MMVLFILLCVLTVVAGDPCRSNLQFHKLINVRNIKTSSRIPRHCVTCQIDDCSTILVGVGSLFGNKQKNEDSVARLGLPGKNRRSMSVINKLLDSKLPLGNNDRSALIFDAVVSALSSAGIAIPLAAVLYAAANSYSPSEPEIYSEEPPKQQQQLSAIPEDEEIYGKNYPQENYPQKYYSQKNYPQLMTSTKYNNYLQYVNVPSINNVTPYRIKKQISRPRPAALSYNTYYNRHSMPLIPSGMMLAPRGLYSGNYYNVMPTVRVKKAETPEEQFLYINGQKVLLNGPEIKTFENDRHKILVKDIELQDNDQHVYVNGQKVILNQSQVPESDVIYINGQRIPLNIPENLETKVAPTKSEEDGVIYINGQKIELNDVRTKSNRRSERHQVLNVNGHKIELNEPHTVDLRLVNRT